MYIIEYLLPIFVIFPGKLITNRAYKNYNMVVELFKKKGFSQFIREFDDNELIKYIKDNKNTIFFGCTGTYSWWHNKFDDAPNVMNSGHGIDEEDTLRGDNTFILPEHFPRLPQPVLFGGTGKRSPKVHIAFAHNVSSITNKLFPNYRQNILEFYNIDPKKKTILYVSTLQNNTEGRWETFYKTNVSSKITKNIIAQLKELQKSYNVIIRIHPLANISEIDGFILDVDKKFPVLTELINIADIVIGHPASGAFMHAVGLNKMVISTSAFIDRKSFLKKMGKNINYVLNEDNCIINFPDSSDLVANVKKVEKHHNDLLKKRDQYIKNWFGNITGFEHYRAVKIALLRNNISFNNLSVAEKAMLEKI